jgi:short subunit dehydrogenase-like uncharacterized protein
MSRCSEPPASPHADRRAPASAGATDPTRIAIAGRNRAKLEALRTRLSADVAIREVDVDDPASVRGLAEAARVVATTVGPYVRTATRSSRPARRLGPTMPT